MIDDWRQRQLERVGNGLFSECIVCPTIGNTHIRHRRTEQIENIEVMT